MKRIIFIIFALLSIQVDAQPWFWGNATYQFKKSSLYWNILDSLGTTTLKYIPNGGGLINTNNTTLPAGLNTTGSNRMVQSYREGSTNAWQIGSWGTGAAINIATYVAGGTMASPTATQATNQLFFITSNGHDGTAYGSGVGFLANAATNWTNTTGGHLVNWDIRHPSTTSNTQKASIAWVGSNNALYAVPSSGIGGKFSVGGSTTNIPNAELDVHTHATTDTGLIVNGIISATGPLALFQVNSATVASVASDGTIAAPNILIKGSSTQSGNASSTTFNIAHGLGTTPTWWFVTAASADAANISYVTADATNIIVHYAVAPASGTNNLTFKYSAK